MDMDDLAAPAEAEHERYRLPRFAAAPSDAELARDHLRPKFDQYIWDMKKKEYDFNDLWFKWDGVNRGLASTIPWELPGMALHENRTRGKYFVTDRIGTCMYFRSPGFWEQRDHGRGIPSNNDHGPTRFIGLKKTYDFYTGGRYLERRKTNWIMHEYSMLNDKNVTWCCAISLKTNHHTTPHSRNAYIIGSPMAKNEVTLSQSFGHTPLNHSCDQHPGEPCVYEQREWNYSFLRRKKAPASSWSRSPHHGSKMPTEEEVAYCMEELRKLIPVNNPEPEPSTGSENYEANGGGPSSVLVSSGVASDHLLEHENYEPNGEPSSVFVSGVGSDHLLEPENYDPNGGGPSCALVSGENVHSRKRPRTKSPVRESFTKIDEDGPDGVVLTYAVCNHCCKVLKGDSATGTSHLRRHPGYKTQTVILEGPNVTSPFPLVAVI
ncbi:unnamed protein product [Urochloa humidicola]